VYDAEGSHDGVPCPECGNEDTISWHYDEGFDELECRACGFRSDARDLADLERAAGDVLIRDDETTAGLPRRPLRA
jgi:uncharacterized metal-binding protein (TIGR02443 family)